MAPAEVPQTASTSHNAPNKLISCLYSQKQEGKYCDIKLRLGEVIISAHACVVGSFSPYVDSLVTSQEVMSPLVGRYLVVDVPVTSKTFDCIPCVTKVIDFMYVGKIQINDKHLQHIQEISNALEVPELIRICNKHSEKCEFVRKSKYDIVSEALNMTALSSPDDVDSVDPSPGDFSAMSPSSEQPASNLQDALREMVDSEVHSGAAYEKSVPKNANDDPFFSAPLEKEWSRQTCPKCQLSFTSIVEFQQHCSTHLGRIYTTCFVCNFAALKVPDLIKHLQEKDHGEQVCSLCLFEAHSNASLKEHLQQHVHPQPFFCQTCNTRFQTRTALNSHIVKHSSETPFRCKECGRGFKWKHGLQSHMVTHTSVKKLLCDQCGFSTAHLKSFIDHKSVHSGETFKCPVAECKFKSVRKESVKQHLSTHSKEKSYQCEICGQAFSQSKNLRRHAAIHDPGVGREQCPLCSFVTTRSDKFRDHFRRFHKDDHSGTKIKNKNSELRMGAHVKPVKKASRRKKARKSSVTSVMLPSMKDQMSQQSGTVHSACETIPVELPPITTLPLPSNPTTISVLTYPHIDNGSSIPFSSVNEISQQVNGDSSSINITLFPEHFNSLLGIQSSKEVMCETTGDAISFPSLSSSTFCPQFLTLSSDLKDSDLCNLSSQNSLHFSNSALPSQIAGSGDSASQIVILNDSRMNSNSDVDAQTPHAILLSSDGSILVMDGVNKAQVMNVTTMKEISQGSEGSVMPMHDTPKDLQTSLSTVEAFNSVQSFAVSLSTERSNVPISLSCSENVSGLELLDNSTEVNPALSGSQKNTGDVFRSNHSIVDNSLKVSKGISNLSLSISELENESGHTIMVLSGDENESDSLSTLLLQNNNSVPLSNEGLNQNKSLTINDSDDIVLAPDSSDSCLRGTLSTPTSLQKESGSLLQIGIEEHREGLFDIPGMTNI